DRVAAGLAARGLRPGEVAALLLPSTPLYPIAYLGAARLGAVTTGINVRYRRAEIEHLLRRSGAAVLLAVESWHDVEYRPIVDACGALPELREVIWVGAERLRAGTAGAIAELSAPGGSAPV